MPEQALDSTFGVETVRSIYDALNSSDISTYLSFFDAKIERYETFGGRHHGLAELKENFSRGRDTWAEGRCAPEKFIVVSDKVVAFVHVRVRQKGKTDWVDGHVTDVFRFQDTRVIQFYSFADREEALRWAGVTKE